MNFPEMTREEREANMFGMPKAEMEESLAWQAKIVGWPMLTMSILSDAQEALAYGAVDLPRQLMNRAKWAISQEWMGMKEVGK